MILNGTGMAQEILADLSARRAAFPKALKLGVLMSGEDAATASFVRIKERAAERLQVEVVRETLSADTTTDHAVSLVAQLCREAQGVIVQLPLPPHIDTEKVLAALAPSRDVDAINPTVRDIDRPVRAPVAEAIGEILARSGSQVRNKKAVVVGAGRLVGAPAASLLRSLGARVTVVTQDRGSLTELADADIVVLGTGNPGMVRPDMLKKDVVLIDAGTSEAGGRLAGDADPACAEVASLFTPVPGGVGPIAVAMIFKNLLTLAEQEKTLSR